MHLFYLTTENLTALKCHHYEVLMNFTHGLFNYFVAYYYYSLKFVVSYFLKC